MFETDLSKSLNFFPPSDVRAPLFALDNVRQHIHSDNETSEQNWAFSTLYQNVMTSKMSSSSGSQPVSRPLLPATDVHLGTYASERLAAIASDALHCIIALKEGKDITQLHLNFPSINYTSSSSNQVSSHLQLLITLSLQEAALLLSEGGLAQKISNSFTTTTRFYDDDDDDDDEEEQKEDEEEMQPMKKMKESNPVNNDNDNDNVENTSPSKKFHHYLKTILTQGRSDGTVGNPLPLFPSSFPPTTTKDALPDDDADYNINAANITTTTMMIQPHHNPDTNTNTTTTNNNIPNQQQGQDQDQEPPRTTRWRQFPDGRCIVNITPRVLDQAEISLPLSIRSGLFSRITTNNYKRGRIILHCTPPPPPPSSSPSSSPSSQLPVQEYSAEIYRRPVRTDAVLRYFRPMVQGLTLAANDVLVFNTCSPSSLPPSEAAAAAAVDCGAGISGGGSGSHNATTTKLNHFSVQVFQANTDQAKQHIAWVRQQLAPSTDNNNGGGGGGSSRREKRKPSASGSHSNVSTVPVPATRVLPLRAVRFASAATITTNNTAPTALATFSRRRRNLRGQTRAHSLITIHDTDSEEDEEEATSPGISSSPSVSPTAATQPRRGGRKKIDNKADPDFSPKHEVKVAVGGRKTKRVPRSTTTTNKIKNNKNKNNKTTTTRSTRTSTSSGSGGTELRPQRLRLSSVTYNSSMYVLDRKIPPPSSVGPSVTKSGASGGVKNRRPGRPSTILKKKNNKGGAVDLFNKKEKRYIFDSSSSSDDDDDSIQSPSGFSRMRGTSTSKSTSDDDDSTSGNSDDEEEEEDSVVDNRGHHHLPPPPPPPAAAAAVNAVCRGGAKTRGLSAMEATRRMRRKQSNPQQAPCE